MKKSKTLTHSLPGPARERGVTEQQVQDFILGLVNQNLDARAVAFGLKSRSIPADGVRITFTEPLLTATAARTKDRERDVIATYIKRPVECETAKERPDRIPVVRVNPRALYVTVDSDGNPKATKQPTKQGWATVIAYAINGLVSLFLAPATVNAKGRDNKKPRGWSEWGRACGLDIGGKDDKPLVLAKGGSGETRFTGRGMYCLDPETHAKVAAFAESFGLPSIQGPDYTTKTKTVGNERPEFVITFKVRDSKGTWTDLLEDAEVGTLLTIKTTKSRAELLSEHLSRGPVTFAVTMPIEPDGTLPAETPRPPVDKLAGKSLAEKVAARNAATGKTDKPSDKPAAPIMAADLEPAKTA